jgi:hypothetical protein
MKYKSSLASLGRVGPVIGAITLAFAVSTFGFAVFSVIADDFATSNLVEAILRLVLASVSLVVALLMFRQYNLMTLAAWPVILAITHFAVVPSGLLAGSGSTWAELTDQGYGTNITGYETFNTLILVSIVLALVAVVVFRKKLTAQSTDDRVDKAVIEFWAQYKSRFMTAGVFTKLAGVALIVWAVSELTILLTAVSYGFLSISDGSWETLASVLIATSFAYLTLRSGWKWNLVAWLVVAAGIWVYVISGLVLELYSIQSGLAEGFFPELSPLANVSSISIFIAIVSVLFVFAQMAIRAYASRVKLWIDKRIAELYKDEISKNGFDGPRTTSILAVFSLIFAFILPIVGLILAHAARNEIAISKGAKFGTAMTIAAAVVSWVLMGAFAFLVLAAFVLLPLLDTYWLADLILGRNF